MTMRMATAITAMTITVSFTSPLSMRHPLPAEPYTFITNIGAADKPMNTSIPAYLLPLSIPMSMGQSIMHAR